MSQGDIGRHVKALEAGNAGEATAAAGALATLSFDELSFDHAANRVTIAAAGAIPPLENETFYDFRNG